MTRGAMEWSHDEVWIDLGAAALWLQPAQLEHVQFSDDEIVENGQVVGWASPSPENEHLFPRARPGWRMEQVTREGEFNRRLTDQMFHTPFGQRFLYHLVKEDTNADVPG